MVINTPPMGWNSWNTFGAEISEKLIMESADAIAATGLQNAGYNYVVIDDIWALKERDSQGRLVPDPQKFPHGMKFLSDYVHKLGLKFGMYSCAGYLTCAGYPGSFEHEWVDAQSFAQWGVDFLKYDFCFCPTTVRPDILYKRMSLALANSGRDILLSACSWGAKNTKTWIKETGAHMWRSTYDIQDCWKSVRDLAVSQLMVQQYNGRGRFNDLDMLIVGMNGHGNVGLTGCTEEEYRTHFSLWAMLGSPLMIGCDVRNMTEQTKQILMNREVLAIDQDPLGCQPFFVNNFGGLHDPRAPGEELLPEYNLECPCLARYLDGGDIAIGLFNLSDSQVSRWELTILPDVLGLPLNSHKKLEFRDLWTGETLADFNGTLKVDRLDAHSSRLFRARVVDAG